MIADVSEDFLEMRQTSTVKDADFTKDLNKIKLDMNMMENQMQAAKKTIAEQDKVSNLMRRSSLITGSGVGSSLGDSSSYAGKGGKPNIAGLKRARINEFSDMLDEIISDVSTDAIRGSDAPIDTVMLIAIVVIILVFGAFVFLQMQKNEGSSLPIASKGKRQD